MKVSSINQTNFNAQVRIVASENKHKPFLYNDLLTISRDYRLAANFRTNDIEFPNVSKDLINKIKQMGINIAKNKKKPAK